MENISLFSADISRIRKEMEVAVDKLERQKEAVGMKMLQTEKDLQIALKQETQAHEEDLERMTQEKVTMATGDGEIEELRIMCRTVSFSGLLYLGS